MTQKRNVNVQSLKIPKKSLFNRFPADSPSTIISNRIFQHIVICLTGILKGLPVVVNVNKATHVQRGQGEGETK